MACTMPRMEVIRPPGVSRRMIRHSAFSSADCSNGILQEILHAGIDRVLDLHQIDVSRSKSLTHAGQGAENHEEAQANEGMPHCRHC